MQEPYTVRVPGTAAHTAAAAEILQEAWQKMLKEVSSSPAQVHHLLQHSEHEGQRNSIHQSTANDSLAPEEKQGLPKKIKSGKLQGMQPEAMRGNKVVSPCSLSVFPYPSSNECLYNCQLF